MKNSAITVPFFKSILLVAFLLPALPRSASANPPGAPVAGKRAAASVIYSTPYLQVDPHTKDYHIAVNVESAPGATLCDPSQMTLAVRFYSSLFFPRSVTRGTIISNTVSGNFRTVEISLAGTTQVQNGPLTELVGDVMLGNSESTPLTLVYLRCGGVQVTDSVRSGDLSMTGRYCEQGSDRLLDYLPGFGITKIVPNPAGGRVTVNVRTVELDETSLEIYSILGERVFSINWVPASMQDSDMAKDIALPADLPNGTYKVVLRSPGRRDTQTLIIAK